VNAETVEQVLGKVLNEGLTPNELESLDVEFKTDGRSGHDDLANIAHAATCFANANGGNVIIGVNDKASGAAAFVGTRLDPEQVRHRIYEITRPPLLVEVEAVSGYPAAVLVINVPVSTQVHSANGKIPTERIADKCEPMDSARIAVVTAHKTGRDWSAQSSTVSASDVDPVAMQVARGMLTRARNAGSQRLADASDIDILRATGVVLDDQSLTNAGALLFTRAYADRTLIAYVHRRTPTGQLTANEQLPGPLVPAIQRTFDLIEARLETTPVSIGKGQQLHIADLPELAVREAVVNGLMHRDYFNADRTSVEHTVTQLRVTSPGGFLPGIRVDNVLTTSSRTRNSNLAGAMRMLGLAETAGTGVDRMYAEMARIGHEPPRYEADNNKVEVSLLGGAPNTALARYVATLPAEEADDADTMVILLTLLTKRTVSADELVAVLQKPSVDEAQSVLGRLASDALKLLEPTRETARRANPKYRLREEALAALGSAVTYRRRTTDQLDRKIIEMVIETGSINARMVRLMLDLDGVNASRLLADLVDRDILMKTSEAKRGPSVAYGKGRAFPSKPTRASVKRAPRQESPSRVLDEQDEPVLDEPLFTDDLFRESR